LYVFSSSVSDEYLPAEDGDVRCKTFINMTSVTMDNDFVHFIGFSQIDPKVSYFIFII
jgi:hypothetical protein